MSREEEIRLIAYRIWEEDNCCHGHDAEHWIKAEAIWEENHKQESILTESKTKSTLNASPGKKRRPLDKKR